jgi:hypothetical protein
MRITIKMAGTSPLLMHNVRLSDPLDPFAREIRVITSKDEKTDEDQLEIARLEFMGGLYLNKEGPIIQAGNILKCFNEAAKMRRQGTKVLRGLLPTALEFPLLYDGPRTPNEMWANEQFRYRTTVRVGSARVQRMRPRFINWQLNSEWELLTTVFENLASFQRIAGDAGLVEGLGDGRKKGFGRFGADVAELKMPTMSKAA